MKFRCCKLFIGLPPTFTARELIFGDPDDEYLMRKIVEYLTAFRVFIEKHPIDSNASIVMNILPNFQGTCFFTEDNTKETH